MSIETYVSVVTLYQKFIEDAAKGKKKAGFKLGDGTASLYEYYQNCDNDLKTVLANTVEAEKITEGKANKWEEVCTFLNQLTSFEKICEFSNIFDAARFDEIKTLLETQNQEHRIPKIPKGTQDFLPEQMVIRSAAIDMIKGIFKKHGAVEIDTPVFELKETLMGKYGEEGGKLIYDLKDQGGELLSLRYDLTVPFARYMATNKKINKIKRYSISKVYRRDQPMMTKGRFREFYQCDIDIAGDYPGMVPDAEIVKIVCEILDGIDVSKYVVKVNHRKLLEAMIELSGAPLTKFRSICSSIDKLDKEPWEKVREELINEKGVSAEEADKMSAFVFNNGDVCGLIEKCRETNMFKGNKKAEAAMDDLYKLGTFLKDFGCYENVQLDFCLARGLDYYTGVIYEAVFVGAEVGSIAGGGRYDELISMFSGGKSKVPAVGVSIGIERIMILLEKKKKGARKSHTKVLVATIGDGLLNQKLGVVTKLWASNIPTECLYEASPKAKNQLAYALDNEIPLVIWIGGDELKEGKCKVKNTYLQKEIEVPMDDLLAKMEELVNQYDEDLKNGLVVFEDPKKDKKGN